MLLLVSICLSPSSSLPLLLSLFLYLSIYLSLFLSLPRIIFHSPYHSTPLYILALFHHKNQKYYNNSVSLSFYLQVPLSSPLAAAKGPGNVVVISTVNMGTSVFSGPGTVHT